MSNIITAKVELVGTRPLLFHHFGEDAIPLQKQETTGVAGNDPWTWAKTVLITKDGQLYVLPTQVFSSIRDGARHIKQKRGSIQPLVVATLQVTDDIILVDRFLPEDAREFVRSRGKVGNPLEVLTQDHAESVYLDIRSTRNPSTKARNVTYRVAVSSGWQMQASLEWDKTVVSRDQMHSCLIQAGGLEGIGSGRKIGMGRFIVASFSVNE